MLVLKLSFSLLTAQKRGFPANLAASNFSNINYKKQGEENLCKRREPNSKHQIPKRKKKKGELLFIVFSDVRIFLEITFFCICFLLLL